jgi:hypothetical protein
MRLTQLEPHGLPGRRSGSFVGKASSTPIVQVDLSLDDGSRNYEKWRYRSGRFEKFLPRDRFGWSLGGGGTPSRH